MNIHLTHDLSVAFEHLAREGRLHMLSYQQVSGPYGREREIATAAVAFVAQLAIECGYDAQTIRGIESDLIGALARSETP